MHSSTAPSLPLLPLFLRGQSLMYRSAASTYSHCQRCPAASWSSFTGKIASNVKWRRCQQIGRIGSCGCGKTVSSKAYMSVPSKEMVTSRTFSARMPPTRWKVLFGTISVSPGASRPHFQPAGPPLPR